MWSRRCVVGRSFLSEQSPGCRHRWTGVVLLPETTLVFDIVFLTPGCVCMIHSPWWFSRHCLPCVANCAGCECSKTYIFRSNVMLPSTIGVRKESKNGERLACRSESPHLMESHVQEGRFCPRWSYLVAYRLFSKFTNIRDIQTGLPAVVIVLVDVTCWLLLMQVL